MKKYLLLAAVLLAINQPAKLFALSEKGFEALNIFTKVLYYVENDYVEAIDEERLLHGAIRGLLSSLDPHTVYLSPAIYKHLKADTSGIFGGVGLEITIRDGWVTVVTPLEGTPAFHSGIQPGDRILQINGQSTKGMDLGMAVKEMRGKHGSSVNLVLSRKGLKKQMRITLTRRVILAPSIRAELLEDKYLYIKISSFQERTDQDLKKVLKEYSKAVSANGLILDMRNNPGGLLEQAVQVSDEFLSRGVIVTTASRKGEMDRREAAPQDGEMDFPMVVLVNGGSASAAEIVAGALQDHHRAAILGTKTFGKGSVQSVLELEDGSALKITIAKYFTPSGKSIQADGIHPDQVVEPTKSEEFPPVTDNQKEAAMAALKKMKK